MTDAPDLSPQSRRINRAEWISFGALALNVLTLVFGLGAVWSQVQDHNRRISGLETKMDVIVPKVERIDANVTFLADMARESREEEARAHKAEARE